MRPLHEEFEDFGFEDNSAIRRIMREQRREERRMSSRYYSGSQDEDWDDYEFEDYSDYDEDEFDRHYGV
tara:strand:- start:11159 stop:11365 length:207 start_codon:yes stop_codon:yes gene_type:complete